MQLPTILLFAATAAALALPEPIPRPNPESCDETCPNPCRQAIRNTYCTGAKKSISGGPLPAAFKNQWNCPAGSSSPPATYIQMTQNGAAEGGVTVFCTI
ncbi:hypothetical protein CSIM01_07192 [Colletotrichum simmondsii]|uniref:Uncharacterized protein n=1 Tax=Colletotrichum simmondsii TaxID=703756 RepID=A0A135RPV5_9PEZI|nr:hypothetical protein CSIM01_07192 [Colletotrichum simmondsii]